jgi:hypothetical protein
MKHDHPIVKSISHWWCHDRIETTFKVIRGWWRHGIIKTDAEYRW